MSDPKKKTRPVNATGRRIRLGLLGSVFLLSVLASVVLANVIAARVPTRIDVTSLGIHELSPRTRSILDALDAEHEIVLAGPWSDPAGRAGLEPRVVRQVIDTLNEIGQQSKDLRVTVIDTLTESGNARFADTLERLVERDRSLLDAHERALQDGIEAIDRAATRLGQLQTALAALAEGASDGSDASNQVQGVLVNLGLGVAQLSGDLSQRRDAAQTALETPAFAGGVGQLDESERIVEAALSRIVRELEALGTTLRSIATDAGTPAMLGDRLPPLASTVDSWRDDVARSKDTISLIKRSDVMRIARALEQASVALVIGPDGLTAIAMDSLFPAVRASEQGEGLIADLRGHTESVVTLALVALAQPNAPIVVFLHGNPAANLFESGAIENLRRELASRRIDSVEWAVVVDRNRPSLAELDPTGTRPVVYVVIATDASVTMGDDPALSGPSRTRTLANTVGDLIDDGASVLLSLMPSLAGVNGGEDELAQVVKPFGLHAINTTPILFEARGADGRVVQAIATVLRADAPGAIAQSLGTLPTSLRWATPIERMKDADESLVQPILEIDAENAWAESEFQSVWAQRAGGSVAWQGEGLPRPSGMQDDIEGPWQVAWMATRPNADGGTQRLVVVGANGWFFDSQRAGTTRIQGVTVAQNPGNAQLFESSLLWLSRQDELIAQGPSARSVARIGEISQGKQKAIAWGLIAGMPLGVLLLGLFWRLVRG